MGQGNTMKRLAVPELAVSLAALAANVVYNNPIVWVGAGWGLTDSVSVMANNLPLIDIVESFTRNVGSCIKNGLSRLVYESQ